MVNTEVNTTHRSVIYRLLKLSSMMLKTRDVYASQIGVTSPQFSVMTAILERPGTNISEISQRLLVSHPFVTSEVGKLVKKGFIEKILSEEDRRTSKLYLTEQAKSALSSVDELRSAANKLIFDSLTDDDLLGFSEHLNNLLEGLEDAIHMLDHPKLTK